MRISFERGVPSAAAQIVGGGMVITAPQYTLAWWVGCALLVFGFCLLMWGIRWDQKPWWQAVGSRYPERHKTILHDLADALAEVQDLALARSWWSPHTSHLLRQEHSEKFQDVLAKARKLIEQIPYDAGTQHTARDFVQACSITAHDAFNGYDDRESRTDADRIAKGIFRYLHDGTLGDVSR